MFTFWIPVQPRQVEQNTNNMTIKMPHQLFINGEFVDAEGRKTYKTINPTDGTVRANQPHTDITAHFFLFSVSAFFKLYRW